MKINIKPMSLREHIISIGLGMSISTYGAMSLISHIGVFSHNLSILEGGVLTIIGAAWTFYHLSKTENYPGFKNL